MHDSYFFLLSGELVDLGNGELRSLLRTYQPQARARNLGRRMVLADGNLDACLDKIMARAALTRYGGRLVQPPGHGMDFELDGIKDKTFACKLANMTGNSIDAQLAGELGDYVKRKAPGLRVSLDRPDLTFLLMATAEGYAVGLLENHHRVRRNQKLRDRPYFHPAALRPKLCRAMINLATVAEDETILDPFCGTGGIMMEAAGMQINAVGCDLSQEMCKGALANLRTLDRNALVVNCDALAMPFNTDRINSIVTDLPYGRAASTSKRRPGELLNAFLRVLDDLKGRRSCIMCRKGEELESAKMVEQYDIYEHRSLTRRLVVCN